MKDLFGNDQTTSNEPTHVAKVVIDLSLDQLLEYAIAPEMMSEIAVGLRVEVPVKNMLRKGYVLDIVPMAQAEFQGRKRLIKSLCSTEAKISQSLIKLGTWMSEYYCCPQELAIRTLLPGSVRNAKAKMIAYLKLAPPEKIAFFMEKEGKKKRRQVEVLKCLQKEPFGMPKRLFMDENHVSSALIRSLIVAELIYEDQRPISELLSSHNEPEMLRSGALVLNDEQTKVFNDLKEMIEDVNEPKKPHTMLLHGVTGSGKTEIYLQGIDFVLKQDKSAIVIVPEIALTPQTVDRFKARFGEQVSVLHSALSDKERLSQWNLINDGKVKIAVGARSVLFAPFKNLGLIVVDEEHESTYKQGESPRYHARDVAVMRGYLEKAVVILGSATPSFESYKNALNGRYHLAKLTQRVDFGKMPLVRLIDMRLEINDNGPCIFSRALIEAIYERLGHGEQVILFLNRRGFAKQLMCDACGYVEQCQSCSVAMTYHQHNQTMVCHWCGEVKEAPKMCPDCGDKNIRYSGSGTEKIEQIAQKLFPYATIGRMDSDTMKTAEDYERALCAFHRGETHILLGTQMIAKGLHFPKVTLVGMINADMSLFVPDFRAEERTFSLITQVAGRAGRGAIEGEVIVQTRTPNNPAILRALNCDYEGFYTDEATLREQMQNPPYTHMILIMFRGEKETQVAEVAQLFFERISIGFHDEIQACEPMVAPLERIKGKYRYMITLRGQKLARLRKIIRYEVCHGQYPSTIDIYADCDPVSLV